MSKYQPLLQCIVKSDKGLITLSFAQIEEILGAPLPPSAPRYPAWRGNEDSRTRTQSNAWMDAGYHAESLDLNGPSVSFRNFGKSSCVASPTPDPDRPLGKNEV